MDARAFSIGELAETTGVSARTIRYYEELGILPEPPRSPGGTRQYPESYRLYVEGALALKEVGFTLEEVRLIGRLALGVSLRKAERAKVMQAISDKRLSLHRKIRLLNQVLAVLEQRTGWAQAVESVK